MSLMDTIKGFFGKAKDAAGDVADKAQDVAGDVGVAGQGVSQLTSRHH